MGGGVTAQIKTDHFCRTAVIVFFVACRFAGSKVSRGDHSVNWCDASKSRMSVSESGMSGALRVGVPRLFFVVSDV